MSERKVEKEKLDQILEVARLSPTACNLQRQRLKVVTSKEGIQKAQGLYAMSFQSIHDHYTIDRRRYKRFCDER